VSTRGPRNQTHSIAELYPLASREPSPGRTRVALSVRAALIRLLADALVADYRRRHAGRERAERPEDAIEGERVSGTVATDRPP
jgi:hypothetical protein